MKTPRSLADLAFFSFMSPLEGPIHADGDYDGALINDEALGTDTVEGVVASGSRFAESAVTGLTFDGGTLRKCRMSDVWLGETRLVSAELAESSLVDTWWSGCVLAGVQAFSVQFRRVSFRGCKLDSVNFRDATMTDVTFEDCVLRDADFSGARLTRVRFPGCTLTEARFEHATCSSVDLRGASLGITAGFDALGGATIDSLQLMALAPLLAHHLGINVKDALFAAYLWHKILGRTSITRGHTGCLVRARAPGIRCRSFRAGPGGAVARVPRMDARGLTALARPRPLPFVKSV